MLLKRTSGSSALIFFLENMSMNVAMNARNMNVTKTVQVNSQNFCDKGSLCRAEKHTKEVLSHTSRTEQFEETS